MLCTSTGLLCEVYIHTIYIVEVLYIQTRPNAGPPTLTMIAYASLHLPVHVLHSSVYIYIHIVIGTGYVPSCALCLYTLSSNPQNISTVGWLLLTKI